MSLVTCCPACATLFKVVPDQLRISEGWVRCGHCSEVFDASAHLRRPTQDEAPAAPIAPAVPPDFPLTEPVSLAPTEPAPLQPTEPAPLPPTEPAPLQPSRAPTPKPPAAPFVLVRQDTTSPAPEVDSGWHESWRSSQLSMAPTQPASQIDADEDESGEADTEPALEDVSFVRQARRRAFWRRGGVRAVLGLLALTLAALLAAQVAVRQRDRLAAARPALRPVLEALCQPLQCRIGPPRRIESVVIDSSAFNRLRPDAYRLSVTLKNRAATEVAMPALELTLTDTRDQPVVRRVLPPSELGPSVPATLPAGGEWSTSLGVSVVASGSASRIAGYRLLAFYP
ncbi:zinc-ribbon and DUF3426 domain-containing protein [Ramlibacter tataouinensis]|uniref:Zinc finger/thioredoxin putative domain-containing protein n=1 Tax=Ramlibacter tataouinensis (strain ATCC BAA-407 / DSM 14655 / LMG 21543 / TTB310) TaxID=365046 RepID=F5XZQ6_RAMTT|nr:zinc-ribbon and DUF3426 domain-containing protein [Ramlibacter tataouinensis]AEG92085.1 conserved hypothetical protein [Ramlibacter tataouinensis TTB310]